MPGWLARFTGFIFDYHLYFMIFVVFSVPDCQRLLLNFITIDINAKSNRELYSSVYCHGNNHTERFCRFSNLCYNPLLGDFIFFHDFKSEIIGVPEDRFSPALTDFSSVHDHNTQYFNFIDLPSSAFHNFSVKFVHGTTILLKRFNPENLMHVFHDDLIPIYVTLRENFLLDNKNNILLAFADARNPGPYAELYEKFLNQQPVYLHKEFQTLCFEKSIVGLNKHSLWYQYGFKQPQGPLDKDLNLVSPTLIHFRNYFLEQFSLNERSENDKALLLTRKHNRKILNSQELAKTIEANVSLKLYEANLEEFSVFEVIEKIMSSKIVIGMHGSLLILSLFLPPYSHIIELFPYGISPNICTPYKTLAQIPSLKLTYHSWENKIEKNTFPHPEYPADHGGIMHLPLQEQKHIQNSTVKPFLCCYNPEWLYRIYQDTIVDIDSFTNVIKDSTKSMVIKDTVEIRLFPSEVQNISCIKTSENLIRIFWEKPWNLNFVNASTVEYELWYQNNEAEDDVKAFIMQKTVFSFKINTSNIYIWIRCHIDGRIGPFNGNPFVCLK